MIQIELTTEEQEHLKEEVTQRLVDLDHEIAHTDSLQFKEMLKGRRESVRTFLAKVTPGQPAPA